MTDDVAAPLSDTRDLRYRTPKDGTVGAPARRMRRSREQRKAGFTIVPFKLGPEGRDLLVELGWLAPADRQDQRAIHEAFARFVNEAAAQGITPTPEAQAVRTQPSQPTPPPQQEFEARMRAILTAPPTGRPAARV